MEGRIKEILKRDVRKSIIIHETTEIEEGAHIGKNTVIWQRCIIQKGAVIGKDCNIGANVFIESGVHIGDGVKIKNNIAIYSGVNIEDNVFLGPNCVFTNVINPRSFINRKNEFRDIVIRKGATIGANATIICGNVIGSYAMVGAGAVVTKNVPDYVLIIGNPGRIAGYVCECGCKLDKELKCKECGKIYMMNHGKVSPVCEQLL